MLQITLPSGGQYNKHCKIVLFLSVPVCLPFAGVHVPVVMLVLEGGVNTLQTVAEATEKDTPVVVIQGSGRAADIISSAYYKTKCTE